MNRFKLPAILLATLAVLGLATEAAGSMSHPGRGLSVELACEVRSSSWVREAVEDDFYSNAPGLNLGAAPDREGFFRHWNQFSRVGCLTDADDLAPALVLSFRAGGPQADRSSLPEPARTLLHLLGLGQ